MELAGYTVLRWSVPPPPPPPPPAALLPRELELRSLLSGVVQHSTTLTQGQGHIGKQSVGWGRSCWDTTQVKNDLISHTALPSPALVMYFGQYEPAISQQSLYVFYAENGDFVFYIYFTYVLCTLQIDS